MVIRYYTYQPYNVISYFYTFNMGNEDSAKLVGRSMTVKGFPASVSETRLLSSLNVCGNSEWILL